MIMRNRLGCSRVARGRKPKALRVRGEELPLRGIYAHPPVHRG